MADNVFLTGATGFLGRRLLARLAAGGRRQIVCLVRGVAPAPAMPNVRYVHADLLEPQSYAAALEGCGTVIHLAAATGKLPAGEYWRVNRDGTDRLLTAARAAGVGRFLFVSTIATKFQNQTRYHYAQSKKEAEELVKRGGMRWTIVRPTIIVGTDAPVLRSLSMLASLPIIPVFGDGKALVQPVDVEELAKSLEAMLNAEGGDSETVEIGGPEVLTMQDLLLRIRRSSGKGPGRILHIPAKPVAILAGWAEAIVGPRLPFTAGQLASFTNDGTASSAGLPAGKGERSSLVDGTAQLQRECRSYSLYIGGTPVTDYVLDKYMEYHRQTAFRQTRFDRFLIAVSARGPLWARLADAYASVFRKNSVLRKKLVLTLALLECTPPTFEKLDRVSPGGTAGAILRLGGCAAIYTLSLAVGGMLFAPVALWMGRDQ